MSADRHGRARFPTTQWSLLALVRRGDARASQQALGELLGRYLPALQAHLIHARRLRPDQAEDLIQEFIAQKILEKGLLRRADRKLGRFRSFLLKSLDRFLLDQIRRAGAKKRSPRGADLASLGDQIKSVPSGQTPSDAFDVAWARGVIGEALKRMRTQCETSGRSDVWGVFECRIVDPILKGAEPVDYQELVRRFGLESPARASNVLITAKRMYARALRSVVAEYVEDDDEMESEIEDLQQILARSSK